MIECPASIHCLITTPYPYPSSIAPTEKKNLNFLFSTSLTYKS